MWQWINNKTDNMESAKGEMEPKANGAMVKGTKPTPIILSKVQCLEPWNLSGGGVTYASLTLPTMYPGGCGMVLIKDMLL